MRPARSQFVLLLLLIAAFCFPDLSSAQTSRKHSSRKAKAQAPAPEQQPAPPPPPPTPEQMPSRPPSVIFQNDLLTIDAQNSTLGDILQAVQKQTGAAIDAPSGATERVFTHLGPGPARSVLASLLNGSHFNYVILGSADKPDSLAQVVIMPRTGSAADSSSPAQSAASAMAPMQSGFPPRPPFQQRPFQQPQVQAQMPTDENSEATDEEDSQDNSGDENAADQSNQGTEATQPNQNPALPNVKTPEQLFQELQRQQQMMQQQQQNGQATQPPANIPPVPQPPQQ